VQARIDSQDTTVMAHLRIADYLELSIPLFLGLIIVVFPDVMTGKSTPEEVKIKRRRWYRIFGIGILLFTAWYFATKLSSGQH
jgi:hypothetical protein